MGPHGGADAVGDAEEEADEGKAFEERRYEAERWEGVSGGELKV